MSLEHVLLGMLRDPASGYELRKEFDSGPRHFWSAELSQIYPTLQKMERRGWLASRSEASARGPARRVYRRTPAGKRALREWLSGPPDVGTERLAYIGQLVFLTELRDPDRTLRFLDGLRGHLAACLTELEASEQALGNEHNSPPERWPDDAFHELLCVRFGLSALRAKLATCDECAELVESRKRHTERDHA